MFVYRSLRVTSALTHSHRPLLFETATGFFCSSEGNDTGGKKVVGPGPDKRDRNPQTIRLQNILSLLTSANVSATDTKQRDAAIDYGAKQYADRLAIKPRHKSSSAAQSTARQIGRLATTHIPKATRPSPSPSPSQPTSAAPNESDMDVFMEMGAQDLADFAARNPSPPHQQHRAAPEHMPEEAQNVQQLRHRIEQNTSASASFFGDDYFSSIPREKKDIRPSPATVTQPSPSRTSRSAASPTSSPTPEQALHKGSTAGDETTTQTHNKRVPELAKELTANVVAHTQSASESVMAGEEAHALFPNAMLADFHAFIAAAIAQQKDFADFDYESSLFYVASEWIFNAIKHGNTDANAPNELPLIEDICVEFPSLSIQEAKQIRLLLVDYMLENVETYLHSFDSGQNGIDRGQYISTHPQRFEDMSSTNNSNSISNPNSNINAVSELNYFHRVGDISANFNPQEKDMNRDPFDSFLFSSSKFDGIEEFDPAFHKSNINTTTMSAQSFYGYNNKIWDSYTDTHEEVQEVESEHGKFRLLLLNPSLDNFEDADKEYQTSAPQHDHNQVLSLGILEDLKRKMRRINADTKTIAYALTSRDRKQFIGDIDTEFLLNSYFECNIKEIGAVYMASYLQMIDELVHSRKPVLIGTSAHLQCLQSTAFMHGSARLADAGTRLSFNHLQYGMIPVGGYLYRMCLHAQSSPIQAAMYYAMVSGEPMAAWDLYECDAVDWVFPSSNMVLAFHHMADDIDCTFSSSANMFGEMDRFRHRAMLKNIIECYDRGLEHYQSSMVSHDALRVAELKELFINAQNQQIRSLTDTQTSLSAACDGTAEFQSRFAQQQQQQYSNAGLQHSHSDTARMEAQLKNSIFRCRKLRHTMNDKCSPLALYITQHFMNAVQKEFARRYNTGKAVVDDGTQFFRQVLHCEYNIMCWLMHFGDFWEGLKHKHYGHREYQPQWRFKSMAAVTDAREDVLTELRDSGKALNQFTLFNSVPSPWMENILRFDEHLQSDCNVLPFPQTHSLYQNPNQFYRNGHGADPSSSSSSSSSTSTSAAATTSSYSVQRDIINPMKDPNFYLHDWTMLRGSCPPNIQIGLRNNYGPQWRIQRLYQGRELSEPHRRTMEALA